MWEREGRMGDVPINPVLPEAGGTIISAQSIDTLAAAAGLPVAAVAAAVADINRFRQGGAAPVPGRSNPGRALSEPPYYAIPLIAEITFAMGGVLVNPAAQVLDQDERPIPGLYAAGGAMGGLQGGPQIAVEAAGLRLRPSQVWWSRKSPGILA